MKSWTARARQRGGMPQAEFLAAMADLGFHETLPVRPGFLHEFEHPATGRRAYCMRFGEAYTATLERLKGELQAGRRLCGAA